LTRPTDQQQLDRLVTLVRKVLGPDALGAYLFGSAVLGGLRPESDLDVLVVSKRSTTRDEKRQLVDRLLAISGREGRRLELTIVVDSEVRPWRYPPSLDFQYGDWLRGEFEAGNLEPWPPTAPDVASLITMVLLANTPLFGPPPAEVLDPVPHDDLIRATVGDIGALLAELDSDTRNLILTLARIWSTAATGVIRSKADAADWALGRLPEENCAVLARARAVYLGEEEERWSDVQEPVRQYAAYVRGEIDDLVG
jgi:predicted nucleotidyltransferase